MSVLEMSYLTKCMVSPEPQTELYMWGSLHEAKSACQDVPLCVLRPQGATSIRYHTKAMLLVSYRIHLNHISLMCDV